MSEFTYTPPAGQQDFSDSAEQARFNTLWDRALDAYTQAAIVSNPWQVVNQAPCPWYVNPKLNPPAADAPVAPVFWTAFPNRLRIYFAASEQSPYQYSETQVYALADFGNVMPESQLQTGIWNMIPAKRCPNLTWTESLDTWKAYDPYGPRGWLDEYCEWAVTRNSEGKILKVSFTCENPEYWYTLWQVSPQEVLNLYQSLVHPNVTLDDLVLHDQTGNVVTDPVSGNPAYNPLNKWNRGTIATDSYGGAVHLTSPPNTIGAEIMLASQSTLLRDLPPEKYNMQNLICTGQFGRPYRNSDPHIGFQANQVVKNLNVMVTLSNPVGLYLQTPDFSSYKTPDGTPASEFYTVVRGRTAQEAGTSYDQILHAVFEVPADKGYTVSDILIGSAVQGSSQVPVPILFAGQIAQTMKVCLSATAVTPPTGSTPQAPLPAVKDLEGAVHGAVSMLLANTVLLAMQAVNQFPPFVQLPVAMQPGQTLADMALQVSYANDNFKDAQIQFYLNGAPDPEIVTTVTAIDASDGVPAGLSSGGDGLYNYVLTIAVSPKAQAGFRGVVAINPNSQQPIIPLPGVLYIQPATEA